MTPFERIRLCVLGVVVFGCSPVAPEREVKQYLQARVSVISRDVEQIRGLSFRRPVCPAVISREEYTRQTRHSIASSLSESEDNAISKEYAQMCFMPEIDSSIASVLGDFYGSLPLAFYRDGSDSIYLIPDENQDQFDVDVTIAHELTHALQDQYFDIHPAVFPNYSRYNSDAELAIRSVVEGDAGFTEAVYAYRTLALQYGILDGSPYDSAMAYYARRKESLMTAAYPMDAPLHISMSNYMPYFAGPPFIAHLYSLQRSWNEVNNLYSVTRMPKSVAEINSEDTVEVKHFDFYGIEMLLADAGGAIEYTDDDNAGFSLLHALYYSKNMVEAAAARRSYGWMGDRYVYVKRQGMEYGTLVWALAFASAFDAEKCYAKFKLLVASRILGGVASVMEPIPDSTVLPDTSSRFNAPGVNTELIQSGSEVWWLENTGSLTEEITTMLGSQNGTPSTLAKTVSENTLTESLSSDTRRALRSGLFRYLTN